MKQFRMFVTVFVLLMVSTNFVLSAEYYVDINSGNNSTGDGSIGSPWQTIQHAADQMASGDVCWIREGIYRETVTPKDGQTFQAFGDEKVVLSGCDIVSSVWSVHDGEIYKTNIETKVLQLFTDGVRVNIARYPNEDGDMLGKDEWMKTKLGKAGSNGKVTFYDMPAMPTNHWVGGYYFGWNGRAPFSPPMGRIIASSGNEITTNKLNRLWITNPDWIEGDGPGYILKHLNALDSPHEWHWQDGLLYLWDSNSQNPENVTVEARVRIYAFNLKNLSDVVINGLILKASSILMSNATDCTIDNCVVLYPSPFAYRYTGEAMNQYHGNTLDGSAGIFVSGSGNTINNSYIGMSWACGITIEGNNNLVNNCMIEDTNWRGQYSCALNLFGKNNKAYNNTINRTGNCGIYGGRWIESRYSKGARVMYNQILRVGYFSADCGSFYENLNYPGEIDVTLAYNICYANYGKTANNGLYIDNRTSGADIHHNVVIGDPEKPFAYGIFINAIGDNNQHDINIFHNTLWNAGNVQHNAGRNPTVVMRNNHAGSGEFLAQITSHNRTDVPADEFTDIKNWDFRIADPSSSSIDAGMVIEGINDDFVGSAPDLGAYEYGGTDWTAGSDITVNPNDIMLPPAAPSGLILVPVSANQVDLSWVDNANNENGFEIERKKLGDADFEKVGSISSNLETFVDSKVYPYSTYVYRVRSRGDGGLSAWSQHVLTMTPLKDNIGAGLVAIWNFQDDSSQTVVDNAPAGTIEDSGILGALDTTELIDPERREQSLFDEVLRFNKTSLFTIPSSDDLNPSQISLSACLKLLVSVTKQTEDSIYIFNKMDENTKTGYKLFFSKADGMLNFSVGDGPEKLIQWDAKSLGTTKWFLVCASYDGSTMKISVNGEIVAEQALAGTIASNTNNLTIGKGLQGYMADLRVYSRALDANEFEQLFNGIMILQLCLPI